MCLSHRQRDLRLAVASASEGNLISGLEAYNTVSGRSAIEIRAEDWTNPLSIFNVGLDKRLGNEIWISHGFVRHAVGSGTGKMTNPLLNSSDSIDIDFIRFERSFRV